MKYILNTTIVALLFLNIGCTTKKSKSNTDNRPIVQATIATVQATDQINFISSAGKVSAIKSATLSTRIMGFVHQTPVKTGDKVRKGQVILNINSADLSAKNAQVAAAITEASVAMKNAEKDYHRFKVLFKNNSASQKEIDDITANYTMAKARVTAAKAMKSEVNAQLSYTNIKAPFSGIVTNTFVKQGDMASPGMPLIQIEQPNNYEVLTMVSEEYITQLSKKMPVDVLIKSTNIQLQGSISEISHSSKNTGGQYLVKVTLNNDYKNILPGMFATIQFPINKVKKGQNSITIPTSSLIRRGELVGVYTVNKQNIALLRWLRIGKTFGENTAILAGLSIGESYVLTASSTVTNGVKLQIN